MAFSETILAFNVQWRKRGAAPPLRGRGGTPMGEALLILHLLAFPFLRPGTVAYQGGGSSPLAPPGVPGGALPFLENTKLKGNYI